MQYFWKTQQLRHTVLIRTGADTNTEPNDETNALEKDTVEQEDRSVQSAFQDEADSQDESPVDEPSMRTQSVQQDETWSQDESFNLQLSQVTRPVLNTSLRMDKRDKQLFFQNWNNQNQQANFAIGST